MTFLASAFAISVTFVAALVPPMHVPGVPDQNGPDVYPAPPGYVLPWAGGEIHTVTQGENTKFTHNGLAAYAFDFDLNYETIVAARAGKVSLVRQDSNAGGCNAIFSTATNYVEIDHGDGTSSLYLHLAQNSVMVQPGDLVEQGQPIALSGETGVTCSGDNSGPGPHLHFQVEQTEEGRYFSQSVPIAFDDVSSNDGVPQQDESYVSGNYGRGKEQKIRLTPHHVPRDFAPVAPPPDSPLIEAVSEVVPAPVPVATPEGKSPAPDANAPTAEPAASDTPDPNATSTSSPTVTRTAKAADTETSVPQPTNTPPPVVATSTAVPASPTAPPAAPATPTPPQLATPLSIAVSPSASPTPTPTATPAG